MTSIQYEPIRRIAVVGAGPAGIFAADALIRRSSGAVEVDVIDRLPCPFGLARYGVAPDHVATRAVHRTLEQVLSRPEIRFFGNVEVGRDIELSALRGRYDAVLLAYGASGDRRLGISGEDLPGNLAATTLVAWYCGHPDAPREAVEGLIAKTRTAVVIGVGNVAVDVTRILAKTPAELSGTAMPQRVLDVLASSAITDIHVLGRRSPAHATFTTKELRELGELADADVVVAAEDLVLDAAGEAAIAENRVAEKNLDVLREWSERVPAGRHRRIHFRFFTRPVAVLGSGAVEGLAIERTVVDASGQVSSTRGRDTLATDLVVRSVGYRGRPLQDVPFDTGSGVVPNKAGRVLRDGAPVPGLYVAGWIKRGPSGIIGTNKKDAGQTVDALLADLSSDRPSNRDTQDLGQLLTENSVRYVTLDGWHQISAAEAAHGSEYGRERSTIEHKELLLELAATGG